MLVPSLTENREKTDELIYFQWISRVFCIIFWIKFYDEIGKLQVSGKFVFEVGTSYIYNAHVFRHFEFDNVIIWLIRVW